MKEMTDNEMLHTMRQRSNVLHNARMENQVLLNWEKERMGDELKEWSHMGYVSTIKKTEKRLPQAEVI